MVVRESGVLHGYSLAMQLNGRGPHRLGIRVSRLLSRLGADAHGDGEVLIRVISKTQRPRIIGKTVRWPRAVYIVLDNQCYVPTVCEWLRTEVEVVAEQVVQQFLDRLKLVLADQNKAK